MRAVLTSYMLSPVITRKGSVSSNPAGHLLDVIALFHISERKLGCTMLFHLFRILFYSFQKTSFRTSFHSLPVWVCFYHVYMCGACVSCMQVNTPGLARAENRQRVQCFPISLPKCLETGSLTEQKISETAG